MLESDKKTIVGILLAAGSGKRFDASGTQLKLCAPIAPGAKQTIAEAAALSLCSICTHVVAVVQPATDNPQQRLHALLSKMGCQLAIHSSAPNGMGGSIRTGVLWIQRNLPMACGCLIALADMPLVRAHTISLIAQAIQEGAPCAAPLFEQQRGHPVGFSADLFDALTQIEAHYGARELLKHYPPRLIPVMDPGTVLDIDTPEALRRVPDALSHGDLIQ